MTAFFYSGQRASSGDLHSRLQHHPVHTNITITSYTVTEKESRKVFMYVARSLINVSFLSSFFYYKKRISIHTAEKGGKNAEIII